MTGADSYAGADALIAIIIALIPLAIWAFSNAEPRLQALRDQLLEYAHSRRRPH